MPRPPKFRRVSFSPNVTYFKPAGVPLGALEEVVLTIEEVEAVRLVDYENKNQEEAAKEMDISQPTLNRLLNSARKKIADALVNGKAIRVEGGNYTLNEGFGGRGRGFGRGRW
jgi:predicted DNA-binding protein (UPF0251 family)